MNSYSFQPVFSWSEAWDVFIDKGETSRSYDGSSETSHLGLVSPWHLWKTHPLQIFFQGKSWIIYVILLINLEMVSYIECVCVCVHQLYPCMPCTQHTTGYSNPIVSGFSCFSTTSVLMLDDVGHFWHSNLTLSSKWSSATLLQFLHLTIVRISLG